MCLLWNIGQYHTEQANITDPKGTLQEEVQGKKSSGTTIWIYEREITAHKSDVKNL